MPKLAQDSGEFLRADPDMTRQHQPSTFSSAKPSLSDIDTALRHVAFLVTRDDIYLPIFRRLECERESARRDQTDLARAYALLCSQ